MSYYEARSSSNGQNGGNRQPHHQFRGSGSGSSDPHGRDGSHRRHHNQQYAVQDYPQSSQLSDHSQSRRHQHQGHQNNHAAYALKAMWECHICGTAYYLELTNACVNPDCQDHKPCPRCTHTTQLVDRTV
ncbi:hypothetical protein ABW20_dc0106571 [Dactylellina cionopaga]|nr:hypothetical protein ABW20_dc0106571 [Dactylellina cionopaga]